MGDQVHFEIIMKNISWSCFAIWGNWCRAPALLFMKSNWQKWQITIWAAGADQDFVTQFLLSSGQFCCKAWQKFCEFSMTNSKSFLFEFGRPFFSLSRLIIVMTLLGHIWPRATPQLTMSRLCDCSGSFMAAGHFLYSQIIAQLNSGHDPQGIICLKNTPKSCLFCHGLQGHQGQLSWGFDKGLNHFLSVMSACRQA